MKYPIKLILVVAITTLAFGFKYIKKKVFLSANNKHVAYTIEPRLAFSDTIQITPDEMQRGSDIYFDKCAGCHGSTRKGATGPSLLPDGDGKYAATKLLGAAGLRAFIENGTASGMPEWRGILPEKDIELMTRFLQIQPPVTPPYNLPEVKASWKLHVPVNQRPTVVQHTRNLKNYFGVIMRDAGKVAIIDGDTKEKVAVLKTGFAVHILRPSDDGRYFYSIGRDGRISMIDLYPTTPVIVAENRIAFDARSVEVSKYNGPKGQMKDKYLIAGGYNPSHFVIMDAQTLEPLSVTKTSGHACDGEKEFVEEARVASIVASHTDPLWVVNVKETGMVWLVDYTDPSNPQSTQIPTARYLHDGGWDATGKYFLVAANASDKMVIIDVPNKKLVKIVDTGVKPHPGRGGNIKNKLLGDLWFTSHLGDNKISFIKTNPGKNQWKVVKEIKCPGEGGGSLFVKTHPKSKNIWVDRTLNPDPKLHSCVDVFDNQTFKHIKTIKMPKGADGRMVHMEYNEKADEVWISVYMGKQSAILIYNDKTLALKQILKEDWVQNPTGKFNINNTTKDIY